MTVPFVREMQDRNRSRRFWESRSARSTDSWRTVAGTTVPRTKCGGYRGCKAVCTTSSPCLPLWMDRGMTMCLVKRKKIEYLLSSTIRMFARTLLFPSEDTYCTYSICFKRNSHVMNSPKVSKRTFASYNFQTHNSFPWVKKSRTKFLNNKYRFAYLLSTLSYFCTN